ncbi:hypothetical protein FHG87_008104 [Trinorchestia longiramus]|nr:hypothetical protein FHG87_008104 [Trinorchestia longiramus]
MRVTNHPHLHHHLHHCSTTARLSSVRTSPRALAESRDRNKLRGSPSDFLYIFARSVAVDGVREEIKLGNSIRLMSQPLLAAMRTCLLRSRTRVRFMFTQLRYVIIDQKISISQTNLAFLGSFPLNSQGRCSDVKLEFYRN